MNESLPNGAEFDVLESEYSGLLLKNSPEPIFIFDEELNYVVGTSSGLSDIFTGGRETQRGISFVDFFSRVFKRPCVEQVYMECRECLNNENPCLIEPHIYVEKINPGRNNEISIQIRISPIIDGEGRKRGAMVMINDITELAFAREKALDSSRAKSLFLTNMSHEVRTPMNAIKGLSELLLLTKLDNTQQDYVGNIVNASDTLLKIINDILDLSKIDGNKIEIMNAIYDITSFLEDISSFASLRAADKGIAFVTDIEPSLPAMLKGDSARIKQVLINLISNAVKYTQEGYVKLSVSSRKDGKAVKLVFTVEDTGIGISEDLMPAIFNAFRHDGMPSGSSSGAGLGLTISRELVQLMGGEISVESEPKKGSAFTFWVRQEIVGDEPLARVNTPENRRVLLLHSGVKGDSCADMLRRLFVSFDYCRGPEELDMLEMSGVYTHCVYSEDFTAVVEKNRAKIGDCMLVSLREMKASMPQRTAYKMCVLFEPVTIIGIARILNRENFADSPGASSKFGKFSVTGAKALIVDDNEVNLIVGGEILRQYGIDTDEADSGALAVKLCMENKYDIIFMDHMMPEMDGVETTCQIRGEENPNLETPIVALTANAIVGMKEFFLDCDMNDFISKPIDLDEMNRVLTDWLPGEKIIYEDTPDGWPEPIGSAEEDPLIPRLETVGIRASEALRRLDGNMAIYKAVLETFAREVRQKSDNLKTLAESESWKEFQTEAHGIKGALANIGARDLSLVARNMEIAYGENNLSYVSEYLGDFVDDLYILGQKLEVLTASGKPVRKRREGRAPDIKKVLAKVNECLDNLENDEAVELLDSILGASGDNGVNEKLDSIRDLVSVFDYDEAALLISEIMSGK